MRHSALYFSDLKMNIYDDLPGLAKTGFKMSFGSERSQTSGVVQYTPYNPIIFEKYLKFWPKKSRHESFSGYQGFVMAI